MQPISLSRQVSTKAMSKCLKLPIRYIHDEFALETNLILKSVI